MSFKIGDITLKHNIVLAPMAGITNPTYIKICEDMGLGYAITELISAEAIVRGNEKTLVMLNGIKDISIPIAIQIFGSNPDVLAKSAQILVRQYNAKIIDINMGCPVAKVAIKNGAGSALLKDPEKIREIVNQVVKAVDVPVTVKIRSGWDEQSINAPLVAKICEEAGAKAITIHARTRSQGYEGKADTQIIKKVVESVSIPVIGNGDVTTCFDAEKMIKETGCTAVMIGRALLGNPWLIKECNDYLEKGIFPTKASLEEKTKIMKRHVIDLKNNKGEKSTVLEMRSNLMYYLKGMPNNKEIKLQICKASTTDELLAIIDQLRA